MRTSKAVFLLFLWGLSMPGLIHAQTSTAENLVPGASLLLHPADATKLGRFSVR